MTTPRFDFTVNLGHVLTFGAMIVTMIAGYSNFDTRLRAVETTLATATQTLIKQVEQGRDLAALDSRVARLERQMEDRP